MPVAMVTWSEPHESGFQAREGKLTAEFMDKATILLIDSNSANRVLMNRVELCVILGFALQVHLTEHVEGGLLTGNTDARSPLHFH
jgi:hypothetical protein